MIESASYTKSDLDRDIAVIESMTKNDLPDGRVKNNIVLKKTIAGKIVERKHRRNMALLKRIEALVIPAGVSLLEIADFIMQNIPTEEIE